MPLLPPEFLDAVVAIGTPGSTNKQWYGTGFFYGLPAGTNDSGTPQYHIFLITNKHVLLGSKKCVIRLNAKEDNSFKEYNLDLVAKNGRTIWVGHPDADVDIGAIWINAGFLTKDRRQFYFFEEDKHVLTKSKLDDSSLSEGDNVFLLGYPMGLVGQHHYAICRQGTIARIRDVKNAAGKVALIDGWVFPGNSGGPVITRPEAFAVTGRSPHPTADLLGIVSSYVPYEDIAISNQTKKARIVFQENSGLTNIHPAELIVETVKAAFERHKIRMKQHSRKVASRPTS